MAATLIPNEQFVAALAGSVILQELLTPIISWPFAHCTVSPIIRKTATSLPQAR